MDTFSTVELRRLTDAQRGTCVTILMPTHPAGHDGQQDTLRLKNLLSQAERSLIERGVRSSTARQMLEPARALPSEPEFWGKRTDGLAVFIADDAFAAYRLPLKLPQTVVVNRRFQFKPLFPLLRMDDRFLLLALSQKQVRLFEGDRFRMRQIPVEDMPQDMRTALNLDAVDDGTQVHVTSRGGTLVAAAHGHGGERDVSKEELAQYFRLIDTALRKALRDRTEPLILAGVQYLLPIFRQVSSYANIIGEELSGNPDHASLQVLHQQARPLIERRQQAAREAAWAKYAKMAGTGKASDEICLIAPAAKQGRVEILFVDLNKQVWGAWNESDQVELHASPQHGDDDLLDFAAVQTVLHRGQVYAVPDGEHTAAAVFRY